jgi:hypothetical protein
MGRKKINKYFGKVKVFVLILKFLSYWWTRTPSHVVAASPFAETHNNFFAAKLYL